MASDEVTPYGWDLAETTDLAPLVVLRRRRRAIVVSRDIPGLSDALKEATDDLRRAHPEGNWTNDRIAVEVTNLGTPLSSVHFRQLCNGRNAAPTTMLMANLAEVLGKPLLYFTDPAVRQAIRRALDTPSTANDRVVQAVTQFRSMTHQEQEAVIEAITYDADDQREPLA
ncbi:hypothetical protein [Allobranchiibius huperziae]|uniref:Uncharacterized protein n=1 Tax=Allobranchiibius huperziae TaxID=1874116 RepID=A0A853DPM6_9MICO|nr:hypothetical protein [Allobranchiibius huperziae]NYJ76530.1 hypothetical protein [Allobranchiibius huperziae]